MTRNAFEGASSESAIGRRGLLALAGSVGVTSLAGCAGRFFGSDEPQIEGSALAEIVGDAPDVSETLPVDIESSFITKQRDMATAKLDSVPAQFDETQIPNGVIRERLNREYERAAARIDDSMDGGTHYERLQETTYARTSAHEVLTAWRVIEDEVTASELGDPADAIRDEVDAFASRWEYVGDGPVRAAIVHADIEREIRGARNWLSSVETDLDRAAGQPLELADIAADVERARSSLAVASYLFEQFRGSLNTERALDDRFATAGNTLAEQLATRVESLPSEDADPTSLVDRDIDETTGVMALSELFREARFRAKDVGERREPSVADAVFQAANALVYVRAFESLRERLEDGENLAVETADDVRSLRADAVDAVRVASDSDRNRLVVDALLPTFARELTWTDDQVSRYDGDVAAQSVAWDITAYVTVAETCRAVPPVSDTVASVLRGDADA